MNTIDTLKQALSALENHGGNYKLTDKECDRQESSINALRAAIASEEARSLTPSTVDAVAYVRYRNGVVDYDADVVISNTAGDCMDESIEWRLVFTHPAPSTSQPAAKQPLATERAALIKAHRRVEGWQCNDMSVRELAKATADMLAADAERTSTAQEVAALPTIRTMALALREFLEQAGYLSHPQVPYLGTVKGDSQEAWTIRLYEAAVQFSIADHHPQAVQSPKANMFHDAGAIAQCFYCQRYTLDRKALGDRQPVCTCGKKEGWSGSFKAPGPNAQWHGPAPAEQSPCDAGAVCLDCQPRNADGGCPDSTEPNDDHAVHMSHCFQGENEGLCKYGEDNCPAQPVPKSERDAFEAWIHTEYAVASGVILEKDADGYYKRSQTLCEWDAWKARALLDAKPQRQPLTPEDLIGIMERLGITVAGPASDAIEALARAIEAAHGITGATE